MSKELVFDLILIVDYISNSMAERAHEALRPGGHLILEMFSARGGDWVRLPRCGAATELLRDCFSPIELTERRVGPDKSRAVVKLLAVRTPNDCGLSKLDG